MNKEFLKLKNRPYFSSELSELISQLHLLGLPKNNQKKAEKAIFEFLLKVKENIYREVDREFLLKLNNSKSVFRQYFKNRENWKT